MTNKKEVINALKLIQSTCEEHEDCRTCPFRDDDSSISACVIQNNAPHEWKIKDQETTWKAFD